MKYFFFTLFVLSMHNISGQSIKTITIKGTTPIISGEFRLDPVMEKSYYKKIEINQPIQIVKGEFKIKIKCNDNNSYPYRLTLNNKIQSNIFYLSQKSTSIKIDSLANVTTPKQSIENTIINSDRQKYSGMIEKSNNNFYLKSDSLYNLKGDTLNVKDLQYLSELSVSNKNHCNIALKNFISEKKTSQFAFWTLISFFSGGGYDPIYEQSYFQLDKNIQNSHTGITLLNNINKAKALKIEAQFPKLKLKNEILKDKELIISSMKKKYVLIDFWFSNCGPCLSNFNRLKEIYRIKKDFGFEIVGISIDKTENIQNWIKIIKDKELNWVNYLDENGIYAKSFAINAYPTNFLLDENGVILKKNITLYDLEILLNN